MFVCNLLQRFTLEGYIMTKIHICYIIVAHKYNFNSFNLEKLRSPK
jgi:hypothetical protein